MAVNLSPVGGVAAQFFTSTGAVLTGGKLYTYAAGTTTPQVTYTTSQGNVAWTNPIVLDAAGRVPGSGEIWLTDGLIYKFVLKDSNDVLIATYDNITGINSNAVAYTNQQEIYTATAGQTVFTLINPYQPGTNSLSVFVDGVNQYGSGAQYAYVETDSTTVTFNSGLHVGAEVKFTTTQQQGAGAIDASQVSYTPPFTDSVPTNVEEKLAQTVSVIDFGAVGDGVTDDTEALKAAFAHCCQTHDTLYFPPGNYTTTEQLNVTSGFQMVGSDQGSNQSTATRPVFACSIVWTGSSVSTEFIVSVKSSVSGQWVMGFGVDKIAFAGGNLAYGCLHLTCIRYCNIGSIWVDRGREYTLLIDDNNGAIICGQSQITTVYNRNDTGLGLVLRSNGGGGLTQMNINRVAGGNFEIGDCDSSVFGHVQTDTLIFRGTGSEGNPRASRKNRVLWFAGGDVSAEAGSKNIIDWVNSEGTSVTIDSQASLPYSVFDRKNGMRSETLNYRINDKLDLLPGTGRAQVGSPVYGSIGTVGYNALLFDDSSQELWQWSFRIPKYWREGKITKFEFLCYSANSGNIAVQIADNYRPLGTGIGTLLTPTTYVNAITGGVTTLITVDRELEISGVPIPDGDPLYLLNVRIGRDGADAADTLVGDWAVFGIRLHWWGNASCEGVTFRYDPSPDVASVT